MKISGCVSYVDKSGDACSYRAENLENQQAVHDVLVRFLKSEDNGWDRQEITFEYTYPNHICIVMMDGGRTLMGDT